MVSHEPRTCTRITRSKSSADMFQMARSRTIPALLTTMSRRPKSLKARSTMAVAWSSSPTSPKSAMALPPRSLMTATTCSASRPLPSPWTELPRSLTTTVAPCAASSRACPRPMPCPAPVTSAILPSSKPVTLRLLLILGPDRVIHRCPPSVVAIHLSVPSSHVRSRDRQTPRIMVPFEQNHPPVPLTHANRASGTWRSPHSPRS